MTGDDFCRCGQALLPDERPSTGEHRPPLCLACAADLYGTRQVFDAPRLFAVAPSIAGQLGLPTD